MSLSRWPELVRGEWKEIGIAVLMSSMVLLATTMALPLQQGSKKAVLLFALYSGLLIWLGRMLIRAILGTVSHRTRDRQHLLLVGSNARACEFATRIVTKPQLGYHLLGYIDDPHPGQSSTTLTYPLRFLGTLQEFDVIIDREPVDAVMVALPIRSCYEQMQWIIARCELQGIPVHLLADFFPLKIVRPWPTEFEGVPLLTLAAGPSAAWHDTLKRLFDIVVAIGMVGLLAPVLLLTAFVIKISAPADPVFFIQTRVGHHRRRFKMLKFRTMVPQAEQLQAQLEPLNEAQGPVFKIKNDPRVTTVGHFLRKTSLDELPQLFNVLKGDMSLVGPRPLPVRDVERFEAAWLKRRFSVKPGMTCLWQVNGRSETAFDEWIAQDLAYIDQWSFGLDVKILLKTIPVVLRGTGAY